MRIEFVTQEDPLYILPLFEELFTEYRDRWTVVRVSSSPTMGSRSRRKLAGDLMHLYGPAGFARLAARVAASRALGTLPRPRGARRYYSLRQLCRSFDVEYCSIGNPNALEFVSGVRSRGCDLIVSVACPYILKAELLNTPRLGCINIHHAPLPRYKGMMPTFWQMYHGEKAVGLTVHQMAARVDEGSTLLQEQLAIEPGETLDHLIRRSKRHAAHCLAKVLHGMQESCLDAVEQLQEQASYFSFPTRADIREFHRRGLRAI